MKNLIMYSALFWLFIFSALSYQLAFGNDDERYENSKIVIPFLLLAWANVLGYPLFVWIKAWLFD